jgi:hypothetical protein
MDAARVAVQDGFPGTGAGPCSSINAKVWRPQGKRRWSNWRGVRRVGAEPLILVYQDAFS